MVRGSLIVTSLLVALAAMLALTGVSAEEARIIQLKHRPAGEIIPLIQPLLGPEDALSGMDYRLIVRTSDRTLNEIERLLEQLDVAPRRLRITLEQRVANDRGTATHSVEGEVSIGDKARITLPEKYPDSHGLVVQNDNLRYRSDQRSTAGRNETTQTVIALDGQRSFIRLGQSVPHIKKILALGHRPFMVTQGIEFQDVTTGFDVLPHVHGDRVRMEITPRLSTLRDPATGLVDFQELATTVEARLGEWIDLGTILGHRNEIDRAILESAATESGERRIIRLKIEESFPGARIP
jgi:hypothetical protein